MTADPETKSRVRCPRCDAVASRLLHQTPDGRKVTYSEPTGEELYRCLVHGSFSHKEGGVQTIQAEDIKELRPIASALADALSDWRDSPKRAAPLALAAESAKRFNQLAEKALSSPIPAQQLEPSSWGMAIIEDGLKVKRKAGKS